MAKTGKLRAAFTLIELLIVVAIIAILAAIAVPNFLEAQVRAKISRARADMRTIHTGLETYRIDHNTIPLMNGINAALCPPSKVGTGQFHYTLERLTTPVSYLTGGSVFNDPFPAKATKRLDSPTPSVSGDKEVVDSYKQYFYAVRGINKNSASSAAQHVQWGDNAIAQWALLQSSGPQLIKWYFGTEVNTYLAADTPNTRRVCFDMFYDASNGTVSAGTIVRVIGNPTGRGAVLGKVAQEAWN